MNSESQAGPSGSSVQGITSLPWIERLSGRENWATWKFTVQTNLELEDLWEAVKPALGEDEAVETAKDRKARAKGILLIEPVNYVHVKEANTAQEVRGNLERAFEDSGLTRRIGLLQKLVKTDLMSCSSMSEYVNRIISTAYQLNEIGFNISEEWIGALLLCGLPEEYRPMIMALENSGIKRCEFHRRMWRCCRTVNVTMVTPATATIANTTVEINRSNPHHRRDRNVGSVTTTGTLRRTAEARKKETLSAASCLRSNAYWYFDSGATTHMTRNKALLQNVKPSSGTVVAANKAAMKIEGTGTAALKPVWKDQGSEISMSDIYYIPQLSVNLLSVNKILSKRYSMMFDNTGC